MTEYADRVAREVEHFVEMEQWNQLPQSHLVWAANFLMPMLEELGIAGLLEFWDDSVAAQCEARAPENVRFVSVGAGLGDTELALAQRLAERGHTNLELVLLELSPDLCRQATEAAEALGMADRVTAVPTDLNSWDADTPADIYFANHSLHHIVELERLFASIKRTLRPDGILLVNDMVGRNGHVRWPEAAELIARIWEVTPAKYRWNNPYQRLDDTYADINCCDDGSFEGVRAEDILPLLLESFHPETFVAFASIVDPFIDRVYGFNLDTDDPVDAAFLDAVGRLDDAAIDLGLVTPTHLIASFRNVPVEARYPRDRSPQRMVRDPKVGLESPPPPVVEPPAPAEVDDTRVIELEAQLHDARVRYDILRNRKVVRLGLRAAAVRDRFRRSHS